MSTDQENRVRVTRASAKRASAASSSLSSSAPPRKKRAVLGDVTNTIVGNSGILPSTPAPSKKKVVALVGVPVVAVDNVDPCGDDPQMCGPYASEIYQYLRESENKRRPSPNYMESFQHDVNANMRSILVDWLVEVAEEYKLLPDTLHLTIAYLDRFLSSNALYRQKLQLLGVSCMLIASKHEEICPPHVEDFCYITDNTYSKQEVVEMERKILMLLNFEMSTPTIKTFLSGFIMAAGQKTESPNLALEYLCNFLAEVCLLEYGCLQFLPSQIAASIVFVARFTLCPRTHPWSKHLQNQTGYKVSDLRECIQVIHDLQLKSKNCTLAAVREKYKQHKFKSVSTLAFPEKIPSTFFEDLN
ncbi:cyclin-A3-1-like [Nymphaea colorata]|nr:cyclin-A3-1-like [Nymphaea colorata]